MDRFINRQTAGIDLAKQLQAYQNKPDTLVLALPRGGVPVAFEIAKALNLPLDIFVVRKLGIPGYEELAMGAITKDGTTLFNNDIVQSFNLSEAQIEQVIHSEWAELIRREGLYRKNKPAPSLQNKTVILVDDGIATGASMQVALKSITKQQPAEVIIATPVAAFSTCKNFIGKVDNFVCLLKPVDFQAVGLWYDDFHPVSDEEVAYLMTNYL